MPMDIRNFFSSVQQKEKKDGTETKPAKKTSITQTISGKKENKKDRSLNLNDNKSKNSQSTNSENSKDILQKNSERKKSVRKTLVVEDSDEDSDGNHGADGMIDLMDSSDDLNESTPSRNRNNSAKNRGSSTSKSKGHEDSKFNGTSKLRKDEELSTTGQSPPRKKLRASPVKDSNTKENTTTVSSSLRSSPRSRQKQQLSYPDSEEDDHGETPAKPSTKSKVTTTVGTTSSKKQSKQIRDPALKPSLEMDYFDVNRAQSEILSQFTFVFTGVLDGISRDDAQEMVKVLGGRVTGSVSSKTDYLVYGDVLEDGRPYTEGSKYKRAEALGTHLVKGEKALFGLLEQYNNQALKNVAKLLPSERNDLKPVPPSSNVAHATPQPPVVGSINKVIPFNPYAKKVMSNPYANKIQSMKPEKSSTQSTTPSQSKVNGFIQNASGSKVAPILNQLWVDKYKPTSSNAILGNQDAVRKLAQWLAVWEDKFNAPQNIGKSFSAPNGPWKAALLSGPPGIGKTTTATLVANESGRDVLEFNASDVRSKKAMQEHFGDITGSRTLEFTFEKKGRGKVPERKKRCIIMDEVDGMGGGDRSGIAELIQMIKHSQVPIICICNDRQNQKLKSLIPYCMDLKYRRPVKSVIANRVIEIANQEGLNVERNAAEAIIESCGNDVRQALNCLQMWGSNKNRNASMTYKDLKEREHSINKDEILRVGLFDATRSIVEGRKGLIGADAQTERSHFFKRTDAYFVDYNFTGLMVHQNYLKVMQGQFNEVKRQNKQSDILDFLDRMSLATDTMSDFAQVEASLREGQNWSLLPFTAALAVKTGYHAGGERGGFLPGFPEFTTWLGRNSSKGKKIRLLSELSHHLNFSVSGGTKEIRLSYLPVLRDRFLKFFTTGSDANRIEDAIHLMDEYGLDRDDIFEKLDEFKMDQKGPDFTKMDSKMKAAFTRAYNQGSHKSQALVAEQGGGALSKGKKRGGANASMDSFDPDAIDDDKVVEEEEEEDDELDAEKIKAMFKKKGGGRGAGAASKARATTKSSKKR